MKIHNKSANRIYSKYSKNPKDTNIPSDDDTQKTPENSRNTPLQEEPITTRGEKYNLRPNPNPNYSDTYRY